MPLLVRQEGKLHTATMHNSRMRSPPLPAQAAWFVSKKAKELNMPNVFLATNGNHKEVSGSTESLSR